MRTSGFRDLGFRDLVFRGGFLGGLWSLEGFGQGVLADSDMTKPPSKTLAHMNGGLNLGWGTYKGMYRGFRWHL